MVKRPALHLPAPTPAIDSKAISPLQLAKQPGYLVLRTGPQRAQLDADAKRQIPRATSGRSTKNIEVRISRGVELIIR